MIQEARLSNIEKSLKKLMVWLPIILAVCAVIGTAMAVQSLYDNKVAKKDDITLLSKKIDELSGQVGDLSMRFNAFKTGDSVAKLAIKRSADSLEMVVKTIQKQCKNINRNVAFVIGVKKHGPTTFEPVKN